MSEYYKIKDYFLEKNEDNKYKTESIFNEDENRTKYISRNHKIDLHLSKSIKNSINANTLFLIESNTNDKKKTVTSNFFKNSPFKNEILLQAFSTIGTVTENNKITSKITQKKYLQNNNVNDIISKKEKRIYSSGNATQIDYKYKTLNINKKFLTFSNDTKIEKYKKYKNKKITKGIIPLKKKLLIVDKTLNVENPEKCLINVLQKNIKKSIRNDILSLYDNPNKKKINNIKTKLLNKYNNLCHEKNDIIVNKKKNIILKSRATNTLNDINYFTNDKYPFIDNKLNKFDYFNYHLYTQKINRISSNQILKNVKIFLDKNIEESYNKTKYCSTENNKKDKEKNKEESRKETKYCSTERSKRVKDGNKFNNLLNRQQFKAFFHNDNSKENILNIMKDSLKKKNRYEYKTILSINKQ